MAQPFLGDSGRGAVDRSATARVFQYPTVGCQWAARYKNLIQLRSSACTYVPPTFLISFVFEYWFLWATVRDFLFFFCTLICLFLSQFAEYFFIFLSRCFSKFSMKYQFHNAIVKGRCRLTNAVGDSTPHDVGASFSCIRRPCPCVSATASQHFST